MANKHTILFVDDEESTLHSLRRLFHREGYDIQIANSGAAGLKILKEHKVSLIVSDQRMPEMIGSEFLAIAKEISPQSLRMMLTGYSDIEAAIRAINEAGIDRFITKPWNDEDLKMIIHDAIHRIDLMMQNDQLTAELQQKNEELEDFNARLEKAVRQRTRELQYKVVELEGKDRIAQHMLSVNSLEETLDLVLQTIADIIEMDKAIIYLLDGDQPKAVAAIGAFTPKTIVPHRQLKQLELTPIHRQAFARVEQTKKPVNIEDPKSKPISPFAVVPILRGDEFLGYIEVANPEGKDPVTSEDVEVIASFALQAAMAISDAQAHGDMGLWKGKLEDVLKDIGQLGDVGV